MKEPSYVCEVKGHKWRSKDIAWKGKIWFTCILGVQLEPVTVKVMWLSSSCDCQGYATVKDRCQYTSSTNKDGCLCFVILFCCKCTCWQKYIIIHVCIIYIISDFKKHGIKAKHLDKVSTAEEFFTVLAEKCNSFGEDNLVFVQWLLCKLGKNEAVEAIHKYAKERTTDPLALYGRDGESAGE